MNPCKGHRCDWCRTCIRGECCGRDTAPSRSPAKVPVGALRHYLAPAASDAEVDAFVAAVSGEKR